MARARSTGRRSRRAFGDASSPGRLEVVRTSPTVLVDAAHNPHGAEALVAAVGEAFAFERLVGVVAILADKDVEQILVELEPLLDEIVVTRSSSDRSLDVADLAEVAVEVFGEDRVHSEERLDNALSRAADLAEQATVGSPTGAGVLVTGSITVVAEAADPVRPGLTAFRRCAPAGAGSTAECTNVQPRCTLST